MYETNYSVCCLSVGGGPLRSDVICRALPNISKGSTPSSGEHRECRTADRHSAAVSLLSVSPRLPAKPGTKDTRFSPRTRPCNVPLAVGASLGFAERPRQVDAEAPARRRAVEPVSERRLGLLGRGRERPLAWRGARPCAAFEAAERPRLRPGTIRRTPELPVSQSGWTWASGGLANTSSSSQGVCHLAH